MFYILEGKTAIRKQLLQIPSTCFALFNLSMAVGCCPG
jgi:hypothetical protein